MTPRFAIVQAIGLALAIAALAMGWPQYLYAADPTRLTAVIALLGVVGVIAAAAGQWSVVDYFIGALPRFGLFGTVVGLAMVATASGGEFEAILAGLSTAFYTTVAGLLGAEWLRITKHLS